MNRAFLTLVGATLLSGMTGTAAANFIATYYGGGGPIHDLSDQIFTMVVPDHTPVGKITIVMGASLDVRHTWVGDLYVEFRHKMPHDYSVVLLDRPGVPASTFGNSADLNGVYVFMDGFAPIPEAGEVPAGPYGPHLGQLITRLVDDMFGEWTLLISDRSGGDSGELRGWSLTIFSPAPGALTLLGLGGFVAARRRR